MAWWNDVLNAADGAVDVYQRYDEVKNPIETTAPLPEPDREPEPADNGGFKGLSQFGMQSSLGVVGLIAFVYLLAAR